MKQGTNLSSLRKTALFFVTVLFIIFGLTFWGHNLAKKSQGMDVYTDPAAYGREMAAIQLPDNYPDKTEQDQDARSLAYDKASEEFYSIKNKYSTHKYTIHDRGMSLLALAAVVGLFGLVFCIELFRRKEWLTLPKYYFYATSLLAFLTYAALTTVQLNTELSRESYPTWADTIFIGIVGTFISSVVGFFLSILVLKHLLKWYIPLSKISAKESLTNHCYRRWLATAVLPSILSLLVLVLSLSNGDYVGTTFASIILFMVIIYGLGWKYKFPEKRPEIENIRINPRKLSWTLLAFSAVGIAAPIFSVGVLITIASYFGNKKYAKNKGVYIRVYAAGIISALSIANVVYILMSGWLK